MNLLSVARKLSISGLRLAREFHRSKYGAMLRNKFVLTSLVFLFWMLVFDQNNLNERRKNSNEFNQLLEEKDYYQKKIEEDRNRIEELKTNNDNLEKFAREQYLMKKDNEDIFIIVDAD
jgi:cell division protein DivIC